MIILYTYSLPTFIVSSKKSELESLFTPGPSIGIGSKRQTQRSVHGGAPEMFPTRHVLQPRITLKIDNPSSSFYFLLKMKTIYHASNVWFCS